MEASRIYRFEGDQMRTQRLRLLVPWQGRNRIVYSARFSPDPNLAKLIVVKPPQQENSMRVRVETLW